MQSLMRVKGHLLAVLASGASAFASPACGGNLSVGTPEVSGTAGTGGGPGGTLASSTSGAGVGTSSTMTSGTGAGGGTSTSGTGAGGTATGGAGGAAGDAGMDADSEAGCRPAIDAGSNEPICGQEPGISFSVCFGVAALERYALVVWPGSCRDALPPCPDGSAFAQKSFCGAFIGFQVGQRKDDTCCYSASRAVDGRPFVVDDVARCADAVARSDWGRSAPCADLLEEVSRAELARLWLDDALAEHASIASFARLTLQLMSLGAPPDLVAAAQAAAADEIEHARSCFALASRYAHEAVGPGPLAIDGSVATVTFEHLAVAAVHEGCVGEALAAVLAGERSERATDPLVRKTLAKIAEDETRHTELAWRTIAWAIEQGGPAVALAARDAFASAIASRRERPSLPSSFRSNATLSHHGMLSESEVRLIEDAVIAEIVAPLAARIGTPALAPAA